MNLPVSLTTTVATNALKERQWLAAGDKQVSVDAAWLDKHVGAATTPRVVFINGHYDAALSTRAAVLRDLGDEVVELVWATLGDDVMSQPQLELSVLAGKQARVAVRFVGSASSHWVNATTDVVVADQAQLTLSMLPLASEQSLLTSQVLARVGQGATFTFNAIATPARLAHTNLHVVLAEGAHTDVGIAHLGGGKDQLVSVVVVEHVGKHATSAQMLRALAGGSSVSTFDSLVRVNKGASGTSSTQDSRALLLSRSASANHQPQLEIHHDDVKCSHGSTTGQLDDASLFYLRSRGVPEQEARGLLATAFVDPVLIRFAADPLRERLSGILEAVVSEARS